MTDDLNTLEQKVRMGMGLPDVFPASHGALTELARAAEADRRRADTLQRDLREAEAERDKAVEAAIARGQIQQDIEADRERLLLKIVHARGLLLAGNHISAERALYEALDEEWPDTTKGEHEKREALSASQAGRTEGGETT